MSLSLTSHQMGQLGDLSRTLLAPHEFADLNAWGEAAAERSAALFRASKVAFHCVPGVGHDPLLGACGVGRDALHQYMTELADLDEGMRRVRQAGLTAWHDAQVYTPEDRTRSAFAAEYLIPHRIRSFAGMFTPVGDGGYSAMWITDDRPDHDLLGHAVVPLMQELLVPALRAGARAAARAAGAG
ncbi:MAG TPA: hypothetical protein VF665_12140, partial [Longimicrobium sp.]|uniref:hypothetical protein n=1 Tax=Longimicrobium sp. TaxID=2029185 RepID=UPI002ED86ECD